MRVPGRRDLWPVCCVSPEARGSPPETPPGSWGTCQGVQGYISSKRFRTKNNQEGKITISEKQTLHKSLSNRKDSWNTFLSQRNSCKFFTFCRYQRQKSREGSGWDCWWSGFFQQRQEGTKGLTPGHKPSQVQTALGGREVRGSARAGQPPSTRPGIMTWGIADVFYDSCYTPLNSTCC